MSVHHKVSEILQKYITKTQYYKDLVALIVPRIHFVSYNPCCYVCKQNKLVYQAGIGFEYYTPKDAIRLPQAKE